MKPLLALPPHIENRFVVGIDTYDSERNAMCVIERKPDGFMEVVYMQVFNENKLLDFAKQVSTYYGDCVMIAENGKLMRLSEMIEKEINIM